MAGELWEKSAVSILSRFAASGHLDDRSLAEVWSAGATEGRAATHPHLTSCAHCRARYSALRGWLDDLRADAHAEADEAFPPERLAAQQAQIFRRLEALERPARIIAFPKFTRSMSASRGVTQRWVATAAAAAFVIGLGAGQLLNLNRLLNAPPVRVSPAVRENPASTRTAGVQPANLVLDEALFYGDLEAELPAPSARYMPTLDQLTPRARDDFDPR